MIFKLWRDSTVRRAINEADHAGYRRGLANARKPLHIWQSTDGTGHQITHDGTFEQITPPLGIADIAKALADQDHPGWPALPTHWYWCRLHKRVENVVEPTGLVDANGVIANCVRIGPFMSEREAARLGQVQVTVGDIRPLDVYPLGMEIEQ